MKKLQKIGFVTIIYFLVVSASFAASQGMGMQMGEKGQGMMMDGMKDLQKQMAKIHSTQDVGTREKMLKQHMEKMRKMMKQMNEMPMMGQDGSMDMQGKGNDMSMEQLSNRQEMMGDRMDMMQMMMGQMMEQNEAMMETERLRKALGPRR